MGLHGDYGAIPESSARTARGKSDEREKMAALGGGRDGRQLCSVLCNLEAVRSASQLSRAEPSCSVPGQDLSLLPTSSPCTAAKPPLGKGLNFGFGRPLLPTLCHYAAQIEKTAHGAGGGMAREGEDRGKSA